MIKKQALFGRLKIRVCGSEQLAEPYVGYRYSDEYEGEDDSCPEQQLVDPTSGAESAGRFAEQR